MVFASSLLLLAGSASAHGGGNPQVSEGTGSCKIKSLPSFIAQGEFGTAASVADVIEVSCNPSEYGTGAEVTIVPDASHLLFFEQAGLVNEAIESFLARS